MRPSLLAVAGLAVAATATAALAAGRGPDPAAIPTADEVERRVMSPFCPGLTLSDCPTTQAAELRGRIAGRIDAGGTNEEIDRWLVGSYGESVLARPRGPAAFLVPLAALMTGTALLVIGVSRWARARPRDEVVAPLSDSELHRLEADLHAFRERGIE